MIALTESSLEKTEKLIEKLNRILGVDNNKQTQTSIFIDESLNIEKLTHNQILLVHALLHRFYASGSKNLPKKTIIELHKKVRKKINHQYFDGLDDENDNTGDN